MCEQYNIFSQLIIFWKEVRNLMKKIIISILAIALTISAVSGAAYALFFDKVTVSGITISTGNAGLEISSNGTDFVTNLNIGASFVNLSPGDTIPFTWHLKNNSSSAISLAVTGKLITPEGEGWTALGGVITLGINGNSINSSHSLSGWTTPVSLGTIARGVTVPYTVTFTVPNSDKDQNDIAGKTLTNLTFELVGTQPL
jgi:hypothetical protein